MLGRDGEGPNIPPGVTPNQGCDQQKVYLYQQAPLSPSRPPQRLHRLLDELRQTKLELKEARSATEELELRLAEALADRQSLTDQLREWQLHGLRWRKRLRQTEGLLKRVLREYRELSRQVQEGQ